LDITLFLLQLAVMLTVAVVCGQLMRRLGQPAVLGELIGGVILGPTLFGLLFPAAFQRLFLSNEMVAVARDGLLAIGMLFFLFVAGLEVSLATVALQEGLIDQRIFVALVFMAIVTSLMSGPAIKRLVGRHV
jgi:Kef-type K+ transport system membrane component KefB